MLASFCDLVVKRGSKVFVVSFTVMTKQHSKYEGGCGLGGTGGVDGGALALCTVCHWLSLLLATVAQEEVGG